MDLTEIRSQLKERVAKGLNFGIEAVEEVMAPSSHLYNEYILLKSKYNDLMHLSSMNTLPYEQIEIGLNQLRKSLLNLIDQLDESLIRKQELKSDLKVQALPTRRTNFFKLLDIHFKNLESLVFTEIYSDEERSKYGRQAVFEFYSMHRRQFRHREDVKGPKGEAIVNEYFLDYFSHEIGMFEVYFKNIKHLLAYALDSEIEQQFFVDTLKSLFSRFEMAMIFYYGMSNIDPQFKQLLSESGLIGDSVKSILILEQQFDKLKS